MRTRPGLSAGFATLLTASASQAGAPPTADELAAWYVAYNTIESMQPKWAVQSAEAFKAMSDAGVAVFYLDVRTAAEWKDGTIQGAVKLTLTDLATREGIAHLPKDKAAIIAVYCRSGHRSALAIPLLHRYGYANAISMQGGFVSWQASG